MSLVDRNAMGGSPSPCHPELPVPVVLWVVACGLVAGLIVAQLGGCLEPGLPSLPPSMAGGQRSEKQEGFTCPWFSFLLKDLASRSALASPELLRPSHQAASPLV